MGKHKGNLRLELRIVAALIWILLAIAIPNLLRAWIADSEEPVTTSTATHQLEPQAVHPVRFQRPMFRGDSTPQTETARNMWPRATRPRGHDFPRLGAWRNV